MTATRKQIKDALTVDDLSFDRATGFYTARRAFFYRHGNTAADFAGNVAGQLKAAGIAFEPGELGEVNRPFKGSASVRASSHWFVTFRPV